MQKQIARNVDRRRTTLSFRNRLLSMVGVILEPRCHLATHAKTVPLRQNYHSLVTYRIVNLINAKIIFPPQFYLNIQSNALPSDEYSRRASMDLNLSPGPLYRANQSLHLQSELCQRTRSDRVCLPGGLFEDP
jgi:hypothetical protein